MSDSEFHESNGWAEAEGTEDLTDEQETSLLTDAPKPTLWRVVIRPRKARRMSRGGIVLPGQSREAETHLQYIGTVISMGPLAGTSEKFQGTYDVKVGDVVVYARYSGQRLTHKGLRLLMVDDDQIMGKVENPGALRVYV